MTVKAARVIGSAEVVAYHCARHGRSIARGVAEPYLRPGQIEERLMYPVTTEAADHPGGYRGALDDFYTDSAELLASHLRAGRDVALLAEGDPLFFSSYMHMHKRLAAEFPTEIIPGVTSVSAASAAIEVPLVEAEETLTVVPGTLPVPRMRELFAHADAFAVIKLGRTFTGVCEALRAAGRLDEAWYVERASTTAQKVAPVAEVDPAQVPYFSMVVVPGRLNNPRAGAPDPPRAEVLTRFLEGAGDLMVFIIQLAMKLAPIGVFCLIFNTTSQFGFGLLQLLGKYVLVVVVGLGIWQVRRHRAAAGE